MVREAPSSQREIQGRHMQERALRARSPEPCPSHQRQMYGSRNLTWPAVQLPLILLSREGVSGEEHVHGARHHERRREQQTLLAAIEKPGRRREGRRAACLLPTEPGSILPATPSPCEPGFFSGAAESRARGRDSPFHTPGTLWKEVTSSLF